jgi:hypothetical protein
MSHPEDVDINEILIRPTAQDEARAMGASTDFPDGNWPPAS